MREGLIITDALIAEGKEAEDIKFVPSMSDKKVGTVFL